eukprot:SAG25_NODE_176_length_12787_cov_14.980060_7_plen_118_part_00
MMMAGGAAAARQTAQAGRQAAAHLHFLLVERHDLQRAADHLARKEQPACQQLLPLRIVIVCLFRGTRGRRGSSAPIIIHVHSPQGRHVVQQPLQQTQQLPPQCRVRGLRLCTLLAPA